MAYQAELMRDRIAALEQAVEQATKRRSRKRKRIQKGGILTYDTGSQLVSTEGGRGENAEKGSGQLGADQAQPNQRRCRNCGRTGHNTRTCQIEREASIE